MNPQIVLLIHWALGLGFHAITKHDNTAPNRGSAHSFNSPIQSVASILQSNYSCVCRGMTRDEVKPSFKRMPKVR